MEELISTVGDAGAPALVALAFALVFAESAILLDLFVPGEVGLVLVGAAAADAGAPVWLVVVAAALGALAGDSAGFVIGRRFGDPVVRRWRWSRKVLQPRLEQAKEHFERRGGWAVSGARWVGALRAVVPVVAGAAKRSYGWFVAWDAPSCLVWSATITLVGYHVGDDVAAAVDRIGLVVSAVVLAAIAAAWLLHRHRRHPASA